MRIKVRRHGEYRIAVLTLRSPIEFTFGTDTRRAVRLQTILDARGELHDWVVMPSLDQVDGGLIDNAEFNRLFIRLHKRLTK